MKSIKGILIGAIITALAFVGYRLSSTTPENSTEAFTTMMSNEDAVEVSVTPVFTKDSWDFEVQLDTHSVELAYDLQEVATLVDDNGNVYKPLAWEGDPPGGHHLGGVLKFKPIVSQTKSITLNINLDGKERSFAWTL